VACRWATPASRYTYEATDFAPPDIVSFLQNETNLTRRSIVEILRRSGKLEHFKRNPQKFIDQAAAIIQHQMRLFIVDGIKYQRIGDDEYYAQELFETEELYGYFSKNMLESQKSVFSRIVYDSDVEAEFARSFELSEDVKVYAKLPGWFKIETPLGSYNPDTIDDDDAAGPKASGSLLRFRRLDCEDVKPYENCVPLLDLKVAAGGFSPTQSVDVRCGLATRSQVGTGSMRCVRRPATRTRCGIKNSRRLGAPLRRDGLVR